MSRLVSRSPREAGIAASAAAASVDSASWEESGLQVEEILLDLLSERSPVEAVA
jgi:hypothetical protein